MNCETSHIHSPHCLDWLDDCCGLQTDHNMILYFMDDFARANLWKGALALANLVPRLEALNADLLLIGEVGSGDEARLGAAARLAEEMGLPFALIDDRRRSLWRRYATAFDLCGERAGIVLVDGRGRPVRSWPLQHPRQTPDLPALLSALQATGSTH